MEGAIPSKHGIALFFFAFLNRFNFHIALVKCVYPSISSIATWAPHLGRTFALPSPYLGRFILGFRSEIRG